ncbi:MAG: sigma-70 family RNA polymerase sigma factor [Acidimicrobiales bacterium]
MELVGDLGPDEGGTPATAPIALVADFDTVYRAEHRGLVSLGYVLTGDRAVAEDLAADAFLAAYRNWGRIGSYDDPRAWLRRVVVNRSVSRVRRLAVEARGLARLRSRSVAVVELPEGDEQLWSAVRTLPKRQAQLIALRYVLDLPEAEAAECLDISRETARTHLKRARRRLAELLGENGEL